MTGRDGRSRNRLVVGASTLGTVFEWYDFFVYGTLASIIGRTFFPTHSGAAQFLLAVGIFAVGFGFRPIGAILFGFLGDRLGRKSTFIITITLMGCATTAMGLVPSYAAVGMAAPAILVFLRILQGLALGGEYGGAATYVVEHAPAHRRGFYTSFIQSSAAAGLLLSLAVVIGTQAALGAERWEAWGWRLPFLFSLPMLGVSLLLRFRLGESPVFEAIRARGEIARNPLKESFADRRNRARIFIALFGLVAGATVIWYTAQFHALYFLQNSLKVDETTSRVLIGASAAISIGWFVLCGWLSDKVGRRRMVIAGYGATLLLIFPLFQAIADAGNPALAEATRAAPVAVSGPACRYNPFERAGRSPCGALLEQLAGRGVRHAHGEAARLTVRVGTETLANPGPADLDAALARAGYPERAAPLTGAGFATILLVLALLCFLSGLTYGPSAALLAELFPSRLRYSSISIPYHVGTGYFGGFQPFVSQYIIARSGDPADGLWYTFVVVAAALVVVLVWLPETTGKPLDDPARGG